MHFLKCTDFRWGYCFQPAVKIKILYHDHTAIVLEAGLWLCYRKEQRRRQQGKLRRARDKSEHKNMEAEGRAQQNMIYNYFNLLKVSLSLLEILICKLRPYPAEESGCDHIPIGTPLAPPILFCVSFMF